MSSSLVLNFVFFGGRRARGSGLVINMTARTIVPQTPPMENRAKITQTRGKNDLNKSIATVSDDPLLTRSFRGHKSRVVAVAFNPSMKQIASASYDRTVMLWNFRPQMRAFKFTGHQVALSIMRIVVPLFQTPMHKSEPSAYRAQSMILLSLNADAYWHPRRKTAPCVYGHQTSTAIHTY